MLQRLFVAAIAAVGLLIVLPSEAKAPTARSHSSLVASVRADLGKNPTGWKRKWCAHYLRLKLKALGYRTAYTRTDARAISFLKLKHTRAHVGAIAVMKHHVGVVTGFPAKGRVRVVSGNHNRKVGEGVYPASRIIAYVTP